MPASEFKASADDAKTQVAQLRDQVEQLMSERVTPALGNAADRAQQAARQASEFTRNQAEMVSGTVRDQPLIAIGIAAGIGFLLGRLTR